MIKTIKGELQKSFKNKPAILAAYFIGSFASANTNKESDFDLAVVVDGKNKTTVDDVYKLIQTIAFPRNLDLSVVDLSSSPLFLYQIISRGERVYVGDEKQAINFESRVLDKYYDTRHLREIYYLYLKDKFPSYAS